MVYNMTGIEESTNFVDLITATNNLSGGLLMAFFLGMINIIALMILKDRYDIGTIMVGVNFSTSIIAVLMWAMGWIGFKILIVPILLLFVSIFIYMFSKD